MRLLVIPSSILIASILCCFFAYVCDIPLMLWIGVIIAFILSALGILTTSKQTVWVLILITFTISMRVPSFFQTRPWGFAYPMVDSAFDLTLVDLIAESGKWNPRMGFEVIKGYSCYPVLHILTVMVSGVVGIDTSMFARFFPFLAGPLITLFFYASISKLLSREVAIWASLMYNLNGNWHFWEHFIREFMALIFFSMCLYAIFHIYKIHKSRRKFLTLGISAALMAVLSHHWTSYNLLISLAVLAVFPLIYMRIHAFLKNTRDSSKCGTPIDYRSLIPPIFFVTTLTMILFWVSFVAYRLLAIHTDQFLGFLTNLATPSPSFVGHTMEGLTLVMRVLLYFGYLLLGVLGIAGLISQFLRRQITFEDSVFDSWFIFSGVYILVTTFLLPSGWWNLSRRSWGFAFFGLVPLGATTIVAIQHWRQESKLTSNFKQLSDLKRLIPLILIFPLVSSVLIAPPEIRSPGYPRIGDSFYYTALWVRSQLPNETIAIDPWARSVVISYGRALTFPSLRWSGGATTFLDALYRSGNSSDVLFPNWKIIVLNRRISQWVPNASANSSVLDEAYDWIYDSESLAICKRINMSEEVSNVYG